MHKVAQHLRIVLGHANNHHVWYRISLTAPNNAAATIFDDLTQVPAPLMQRTLSNPSGSSSFKLLKEVQAAGGVMRTVVAMKHTVMKIAVHNRQQVMIPDVQKVINQSGNVSADIFNTRLIKPPTSVLVFPLKVKQHIFGVIFCMSSVQTDFSEVSPKLRETCEIMSPHLLYMLAGPLNAEYKALQNTSIANTANIGTGNSVESLSGLSPSLARSDSLGVSLSGDSFMYNQSRSSTGALVTGLTEKLNQKRIRSSMDFNMVRARAARPHAHALLRAAAHCNASWRRRSENAALACAENAECRVCFGTLIAGAGLSLVRKRLAAAVAVAECMRCEQCGARLQPVTRAVCCPVLSLCCARRRATWATFRSAACWARAASPRSSAACGAASWWASRSCATTARTKRW